MKVVLLVIMGIIAGCQYYEREQNEAPQPQQVSNPVANPKFTVLRATLDDSDLGDITLFCIDGITYVVVPGIGMSVKYTSDKDGDPYVETCINR